MLTSEQSDLIRQNLEESARKLRQNAQSSLQMSMDPTDTGRDSIDQSVTEGMLSTDLRLRDREQKLLNKIQKTIRRLDEGTLDECEDCGDPIGFKRLLARPVTTLCIHCKEEREEHERQEANDEPGSNDRFTG
jgi:RNA polymerase-binding transcription factor